MLTRHTGRLELPYTDRSKISFNLPRGMTASVHMPGEQSLTISTEAMLGHALDHPLASARLEEMARPGDQVLVICDDVSRPTPVHLLMPSILDRLNRAGVPDRDVAILFALGTHRPMTGDEMRAKVGDEAFQRVACHNHDAFDRAALRYFGKLSEGIGVWLNGRVAAASLMVGIGELSPHIIAGYGGGAKILYPGVAGKETIADFHATFNLDPTNYYGIYPAPARTSIQRLAEVAGLDFVVNCVLGDNDQVHAIFAGDHRVVVEAGVVAAQRVHGVAVQRLYDVVVVSSYPHWRDFWQGCKGIFAGAGLAKPGGEIIVVAACPDGAAQTHPDYIAAVGMEARELARRVARRACNDVISAAGALKLAQMREQYHIGLVTDGLRADEIAAMGFVGYATVDDALDAALSRRGRVDEIAVLPYGGQTFCYRAGVEEPASGSVRQRHSEAEGRRIP
jgi:nickel-dependent lactate racemase